MLQFVVKYADRNQHSSTMPVKNLDVQGRRAFIVPLNLESQNSIYLVPEENSEQASKLDDLYDVMSELRQSADFPIRLSEDQRVPTMLLSGEKSLKFNRDTSPSSIGGTINRPTAVRSPDTVLSP